MPTLILATDRDGKLKGRCDGRCYNATWPRCLCICGGINHGVGLQNAAHNTQLLTREEMLKTEFALSHSVTDVKKAHDLAFLAHPRLFTTE